MRGFDRSIGALLLIAIFVVIGSAQTSDSWMAISSADGEFTGIMPLDSLVVNEDKRNLRLATSSADIRLDVWRNVNFGGRRKLRANANSKLFELGKTRGQITVTERSGQYTVSVYAISRDYTYRINAATRRGDDPRLRKFLAALKFEGKPLLTLPNLAAAETVVAVDMKELKSGPVVKEYLKKPVNKDVLVKFEPIADRAPAVPSIDDDQKTDDVPDTSPFVTRPLVMLSQPLATYTDSARRNNISGHIKAVILFKADGTIGAITVDPTLDKSLAKNVAEVAKQIKFLPKQVEGKSVDVESMLVYSFSIY